MRRSMIHSCTVRPVRRRTTVVRCPGRHAEFARHVAQRQRLAVTLVDHREHVGQQRFTAAPQIGHHVAGQTRELDQQQRQVRQGRLPIGLLPRGQLGFDRRESRYPTPVAGPRVPPAAAPRPRVRAGTGRAAGARAKPATAIGASSPSAAGSKNTRDPVIQEPSCPGSSTSPGAATYTRPAEGTYQSAGKSWM